MLESFVWKNHSMWAGSSGSYTIFDNNRLYQGKAKTLVTRIFGNDGNGYRFSSNALIKGIATTNTEQEAFFAERYLKMFLDRYLTPLEDDGWYKLNIFELDMIEFEEKRNLAYKNLHEVFGFGCCFQHIVYDIWLQQALPIIIEKVKGEIKEGEAVEPEVIQKELSNMYYKC